MFGEFYTSVAVPGAQTTNNVAVIAATINTPTIEAGNYLIKWNYTWDTDLTTAPFIGVLNVNTIAQWFHLENPVVATPQASTAGGFVQLALGAGTHVIDLIFLTTLPAQIATISQITMTFWKVD